MGWEEWGKLARRARRGLDAPVQ